MKIEEPITADLYTVLLSCGKLAKPSLKLRSK